MPERSRLVHEPTGWSVDPDSGLVFSRLGKAIGGPERNGHLVANHKDSGRQRTWRLKQVVWEAVNQRRLPPGYGIDYINGNKQDIRYANLVLVRSFRHPNNNADSLVEDEAAKLALHEPSGFRVDIEAGHVYSPRRDGTWKRARAQRNQRTATRDRQYWRLPRIVWEAATQEPIPDGMVVDAVDGDLDNTAFANLRLRPWGSVAKEA